MKIARVEVIPIRMPVIDRVRIRDSYGWKTDSRYNIVRITGDNGVTGVGEASFTDVWSGERQSASKEVIENVLIPAIMPLDLFDVRRVVAAMDKAVYGHLSSKAAVEMAVLDLGAPLPTARRPRARQNSAQVFRIRHQRRTAARYCGIRAGTRHPDGESEGRNRHGAGS